MKRIKIYVALAAICAVSLVGCRPEGENILSYGYNDAQAFAPAGESYAAQFEVLWTAMNCNYGIWDYEEELGVDWDQVHKEYLPKFKALDDTTRQTRVDDKELDSLYSEVLNRLHDGHLYVQIKNMQTGKNLSYSPSTVRNLRERGEELRWNRNNSTDLHYYINAGEWRMLDFDETNISMPSREHIFRMSKLVLSKIPAFIATLPAQGTSAAADSLRTVIESMQGNANDFIDRINNGSDVPTLITDYNFFCEVYRIPCKMMDINIQPVDNQMANRNELRSICYALFPGNIAYLRFSSFALGKHLDTTVLQEDSSSVYASYQWAINRIWHHWFDTIQVLSKNNELGGVIIDLRNNGGGNAADYQYVLGALLPSGGFISHTMRTKNGMGRLDYGPNMPFRFPTYPAEHAVIDKQPVVVLANVNSVSMAEITSWGAKNMPGKNGKLIGTRTWGGLSCLIDDPTYYSLDYSGCFGVENVTPVYVYCPRNISLYGEENKILEGVGITPDIEATLDTAKYLLNGQDTQLERALEYIKTGN